MPPTHTKNVAAPALAAWTDSRQRLCNDFRILPTRSRVKGSMSKSATRFFNWSLPVFDRRNWTDFQSYNN